MLRWIGSGSIVALLLTVMTLSAVSAAQEATPIVAGCTVAPRTVDDVIAAAESAATPVASPGANADDHHDATPPARGALEPVGPGTPIEIELPEGTPAAAADIVAGRVTLEAFLACLNAGEVLRTLALVTDGYIVQSFGRTGLTEENIAEYVASPQPVPPEQQRQVIAVRDARMLADGRVAALFDLAVIGGEKAGDLRTDFVIFAPTAEGLLIETVRAGLPAADFGPTASPTP